MTEAGDIGDILRRQNGDLKTPCYLFDPHSVVARYQTLRKLLGTELIVSLKANSNTDLFIRCCHAFTDGVEVAGLKELEIVVGRTKTPRYLNNPSMDGAAIRAALASGTRLIIDNLHQVDMLVAQPRSKDCAVLLRLNTSAFEGAGVRGGEPAIRHDHFGMSLADARLAAWRLAQAGVCVKGIHAFAGSHSFAKRAVWLVERIARVLGDIEEDLGHALAMVNLGGGFPPAWEKTADDIARYAERLAPLRQRYTLMHEAGRAIFAAAGRFATRVVASKQLNDRLIVICDGGIAQNFLLAQTENPLRHLVSPTIYPTDGERTEAHLPVIFVGSSCSQHDVIGGLSVGSRLPRPGDLCVFDNCGAYNQTYSMINFVGAKYAAAYIVA